MVISRKTLLSWCAAMLFGVLGSTSALAIPALQLGPGSGNWVYNTSTQTWVTYGSNINLNAFANATAALGGNGAYGWQTPTANPRWAYLVVSATPMVNFDAFDLGVSMGGTALNMVASGYGAPPIQDKNSLAPHGIFNTWYEVYEFNFNGSTKTISDQQPGGTGTGQGYVRNFDITVLSKALGVSGVHFDLFTVENDGSGSARWDANCDPTKSTCQQLYAFAPFSHDAEAISEPTPLAVLGFGLLALGWMHSHRRRAVRVRA